MEEGAAANGEQSFHDFERELRGIVFDVGGALVVLFLGVREQRVMEQRDRGRFEWLGRTFRPPPPIARNPTTMFGVVRYWRTYMREVAGRKRHGARSTASIRSTSRATGSAARRCGFRLQLPRNFRSRRD